MEKIPGFDSYSIDEDGNVYSVFARKVRKVKITKGYKSVGLRKDGKYHYINCHRLVAMTFLGCPEGFEHLQVCHKDGDRSNNNVNNLVWATAKENTHDKYGHGTMYNGKKGESHHAARLTEELVIALRKEVETTDCMELSKKYNIPKLTIYDAVTGKSWKLVNDKQPPVSLKGRQNKEGSRCKQ